MMPYISKDRRFIYRIEGPYSGPEAPASVGELNFLITSICRDWATQDGLSYSAINDVVGVLECVKQEFYRRMAAQYEDKKIKENGDVY